MTKEQSKNKNESDLNPKVCSTPGGRVFEMANSFPLLERRVWDEIIGSFSTTKACLRPAGK